MRSKAIGLLFAAALCGCSHGNTRNSLHFQATTHAEISVVLDLSSAVVGEQQAAIVHVARRGTALPNAAVRIAWAMDGMPMGARSVTLVQSTPGVYEQRAFLFSMPGVWRVRVEVRDAAGIVGEAVFTAIARE